MMRGWMSGPAGTGGNLELWERARERLRIGAQRENFRPEQASQLEANHDYRETYREIISGRGWYFLCCRDLVLAICLRTPHSEEDEKS